MDPDKALLDLRGNAKKVQKLDDDLGGSNDPGQPGSEACNLAEDVKNLDEWILKGGFLPTEWAAKCNGGLLSRAELAQRVYEEAFEGTQSFEGELGTQLAYLLGAILKGDAIHLVLNNDEQNEVHQFFQSMFPAAHPVWKYIETRNDS